MMTWLARLRDRVRRREIKAAFDEEMRFHLDQLEADHCARGLAPEEARRAAQRDFGNATRAREDLHERAGLPFMDEFMRDLRHAWRGLVRRPLFTAGVVGVLALGLGAAATIHGLAQAIVFSPLAVPDPDELHIVLEADAPRPVRLSHGTARRLAESVPGGAAGFTGPSRFTVQRDGQPAGRVMGELVTGGFFRMMRLAPEAGRLLEPLDDEPGAPAVAVASHAWATVQYGTPQAAVGREIWVNRQRVAIVGVLPPEFRSTTVGRQSDLWLATAQQASLRYSGNAWSVGGDDRPNDPDWTREERVSWLNVLMRVPAAGNFAPLPAVLAAFAPQRDALAGAFDQESDRDELQRRTFAIQSAPGGFSSLREDFRSTGLLLGGLVAAVLILACANVSGLLLVRILSRHRELGVRLALGSGRWRVGRLALAEALILSAGGALTGWILATWLYPVATGLLAPGQTVAELTLSPGPLAVMAALTLGSALVCGLGPVMFIARLEPLVALAGHGGLRGAAGRIGRALVGAQLALAVLLVAVAYTLGGELARTLTADPGFARENVLSSTFDAASAGYGPADRAALVDRIDAEIRAVPGVVDTGFSVTGILAGSVSRSGITFRDPRARIRSEAMQGDIVRPGFFRAAGRTLLAGRDFSPDDRAGTPPVAVVSAAFARRVFGDLDPIGQRFGFGSEPSAEEDMTIVGVVADAKLNAIREEAPAVFYRAAAQVPDAPIGFVAVRVEGPVAPVQRAIESALGRAEPAVVFTLWRTLDERVLNDLGPARAASKVAGTFAGVALLLAAAGVAASLGYLVTLRQRELALRIAIGADPGRIRWAVLVDAIKLGAIGAGIGLLAAWLLPLIPAVGALLPARLNLGVALVAAATAILATVVAGWSPARRASRADLLVLLKSE